MCIIYILKEIYEMQKILNKDYNTFSLLPQGTKWKIIHFSYNQYKEARKVQESYFKGILVYIQLLELQSLNLEEDPYQEAIWPRTRYHQFLHLKPNIQKNTLLKIKKVSTLYRKIKN